MEGSQKLKRAFQEFQQLDHDDESDNEGGEADEDLLNNQDQDFDIQQYIQQENLQFLEGTENQSPNDSLENDQQIIDGERLKIRRFDSSTHDSMIFQNREEYKQEEDFEFDHYNQQRNEDDFLQNYGQERSHYQQQQNQILDSERSNFTQESCSPPDTGREHNSQIYHQQDHSTPLNIEDLTNKLNQLNKHNSLNNQEGDSELGGINQSDHFTMIQNSPGKESLMYSFQGQQTSNFPNNLRDSSMMKLRDALANNDNQYQDAVANSNNNNSLSNHSYKNNQSENSGNGGNGFNSSFYKFEGQKIKDFEKSTLIKFEEFEGGDQSSQQSDPYRKQSERGISDRIYERQDQQRLTPILTSSDETQQEENQQQFSNSPFYKDRQLPLFVITEEEHSEIQSSYHTFNRLQSINSSQQEKQGNTQGGDFLRMNNEATHYSQFNPHSRDQYNQIYQKSKSQPINQKNSSKGSNRFSQGTNIDPHADKILKTDTSPMGPRQSSNQYSPQFKEAKQGAFNYSRVSTESPIIANYDNDQLSMYFQRMHSNQGHRNINITNPDFVMSDEDLLSNIDRVSKILPTNEVSEDDPRQSKEDDSAISPWQKIKDYKQIIEHLKCENQNKQTLIIIKESQMNLLQLKNEQLEEKIVDLEAQLSVKKEMVDASTQISVEVEQPLLNLERKKIRKKSRQANNSGLKKTPSRGNESIQEQNFGQYAQQLSKNSSIISNNVFDTPQIKLEKILKESPSTQTKNNNQIQKQHSTSFNNDEINHFKQQIAFIKQQLQRSEENNLTLQQKIEKQKKDKNLQKEKIFELSIDKNDLSKQVAQLQKEQEMNMKKFEGLKLDISDYIRQIQILELKLNQKQNTIEREVSARSLALTQDEGVQTDFLYNQSKRNSSRFAQFNFQGQSASETKKAQEDNNLIGNVSEDSLSAKSLINIQQQQQQTITIINNKQELQVLLGRAKNYEQMSLQLQNEINEHRRILKENQERILKNYQEQQDQRRRIKKRDSKINKLKQQNELLEKERIELKIKLADCQQKVQDTKLKMEAKVQEKEFKLISLKNQIKHFAFATPSGVITPVTPNQQPSSSHGKLYNHQELYAIVNSIIQQQFQGQINSEFASKRLSTENLHKNQQRAKSHDQPYKNDNFGSFYENQNMNSNQVDEPRILTSINNNKNNMIFYGHGENASFSQQNDNNTFLISNRKTDTYQSPTQQQFNSHNYKRQILPSIHHNNDDNASEIQQIFNSSMKRINHELESIRGINNDVTALLNERSTVLSQQSPSNKKLNAQQFELKKQRVVYQYNPIKEESKQPQKVVYEDSLQSQIAERDNNLSQIEMLEQEEGIPSDISNILQEQQQMRDNYKRHQDSLENFHEKTQLQMIINNQRKISSLQNTHSFRIPQTISQNTPNNYRQSMQSKDYASFSNQAVVTQNQDREQNASSIILDFKPAFENSNFTNTSNLNQTQLQKDKSPITKFETQAQSLNSSIKARGDNNQMRASVENTASRGGQKHLRLNSNMMSNRDNEIDTISPSSVTEEDHVLGQSQALSQKKQHQVYKASTNSYLDDKIEPRDIVNSLNSPSNGDTSSRRYKSIEPHGGNGVGQKKIGQQFNSNIKYQDLRGQYNQRISAGNFAGKYTPDQMVPYFRNSEYNQNLVVNMQSSITIDGSKSTLSNYSQKLEDLRKRYGRLN